MGSKALLKTELTGVGYSIRCKDEEVSNGRNDPPPTQVSDLNHARVKGTPAGLCLGRPKHIVLDWANQ